MPGRPLWQVSVQFILIMLCDCEEDFFDGSHHKLVKSQWHLVERHFTLNKCVSLSLSRPSKGGRYKSYRNSPLRYIAAHQSQVYSRGSK